MIKILKQALVSLLLFGAVLFGFSRVNWLSVFHLERDVVEEKLGKLYWDMFSKTETFVEDEEVLQPVDSLLAHICAKNGIEKPVRLHIIRSEEVNAFAFPDRHLVIFSALIADCKNEMELCGVMAHEIAHIEKGHVMKKLIKEVGLSVLAKMIAGNDGGAVLKETAKLLSSTTAHWKARRTSARWFTCPKRTSTRLRWATSCIACPKKRMCRRLQSG